MPEKFEHFKLLAHWPTLGFLFVINLSVCALLQLSIKYTLQHAQITALYIYKHTKAMENIFERRRG